MALFATLVFAFAASSALASNAIAEMQQSFYFDWNIPTQPVPVPTTAQCDVIQITWSRGNAVGPNPTAPYYLQVYTSTFIVPFVIPAGSGLSFNWTVPFIPTTQYQICMFDSMGNTGGCQSIYTVYPAAGATLQNPPTCTNLTYPAAPLQVEGTVSSGPLSQFGWVDQCTDLTLTPTNGTPPYTMTIAPSLRPPFNITSNSMSAITWTVALSWGSPFFVSLADSTGLVWSNGPLHSGGGGGTECLSLSENKIAPAIAVGSAVGSFVFGSLLAFGAAYFFASRQYARTGRRTSMSSLDPPGDNMPYDPLPAMTGTPSRTPLHMGNYHVEPFRLTNEPESQTPASPPNATVVGSNTTESDPASGSAQRSHVYVVHHDGGRAPVTVYTDGADVVELPPTYVRQEDGQLQPARRAPNPLPRKPGNPAASRSTQASS